MSVRTILQAAFALPVIAVGCGGSAEHPADLAALSDLSTIIATTVDMAGDMAASADCSTMSFPSDATSLLASESAQTSEGFDWVDQIGSIVDNSDGTVNFMQYGYWHETGAAQPSLPHTATFSTSATYSACVDCLAIELEQPTNELGDPSAGALYFAQSGTITATALDHANATGTIAVSGSNIRLVHWQLAAGVDHAAPDGNCIDVASFDFSAQYDNSTPDL